MAAKFQPFRAATRRNAPDYIKTEIQQGEADRQERMRRFQEAQGAVKLYDRLKSRNTGGMGGQTGQSTARAQALRDSSQAPSAGAGGAGGGGGANPMGLTGGAGPVDPVTAAAALFIGNEANASKTGYRPDNPGEWMKQIATGETLETDLDERFPDRLGLDEGSRGRKIWDATVSAPSKLANPVHYVVDAGQKVRDMRFPKYVADALRGLI